jgi:hypothetical protein
MTSSARTLGLGLRIAVVLVAVTAGTVAISASPAAAAAAYGPNTLGNGGFERPINTSSVVTYVPGQHIGKWVVGGSFGANPSVDVVTDHVWDPFKGDQSLDLNGVDEGQVCQTVSGLTNGASYRLGFSAAINPAAGAVNRDIAVDVFNASGDAYGWVAHVVYAGGTAHDMRFVRITQRHLVIHDVTATICFSAIQSGGSPNGAVLDNVAFQPRL